jgi:deoxyribodipyrimidine photo-lyase
MGTVIWWIRRDLRLHDNWALHAALQRGDSVVPVFVLDPALLDSAYLASKRLAFLLEGLGSLDDELQRRGSRLILRSGRPISQLRQLVQECQAEAIVAEADYSPYARRRDAEIGGALPLQLTGGLMVHEPGAVVKANGDAYTVYTPYRNSWRGLPHPNTRDVYRAPTAISSPMGLSTVPLPDEPRLPPGSQFPQGEMAARERLRDFCVGEAAPVYGYAESRNRLDQAGTARLSPYLRFGMLSAREAVAAAIRAEEQSPSDAAREGASAWLNELIWREFYMTILNAFPQVRRGSFRPEYEHVRWLDDADSLEAWKQGRTGYPVVDAAMRQLRLTGWVHNRARIIVASFLVKDLLIDWREGELWFMQQLLDGEPAANNGGWQWAAGTGTDAAPYFRVFNPVLQGKKYDPHGSYIRRWIPELGDVPDKYLNEPWRMSEQEQTRFGCRIGHDYPAPIVDHQFARERALAAYARARESLV